MPHRKPKGNAVKDQQGKTAYTTPLTNNAKRPLPSAALKLNFSSFSARGAIAKNLISRDGRTTEGTHINPNKELMLK